MNDIIKKIWEFFRPVLLPIGAVILIAFLFRQLMSLTRGEHQNFLDRMNEIQKIHDFEMKKVMEAQAQERERHEQNLRQLHTDLNSAVQRHEEKLKELEHQKQEEGRRLLEKYKDDPVGLAREMGRVTGIPVYVDSNTKK
jgi:hypothetical protein